MTDDIVVKRLFECGIVQQGTLGGIVRRVNREVRDRSFQVSLFCDYLFGFMTETLYEIEIFFL